jgi:hypothetical protein
MDELIQEAIHYSEVLKKHPDLIPWDLDKSWAQSCDLECNDTCGSLVRDDTSESEIRDCVQTTTIDI